MSPRNTNSVQNAGRGPTNHGVQILTLIIIATILSAMSQVLIGQANALQITAHSGEAGLVAYNIMMNVKINGHPIKMELDTGMDFTLIPSNTASQIGLDQLPTSGTCQLTGISGSAQTCDVKVVTMQIENSHPFYTKVLLAPQSSSNMPPLLSAYALYQAYHLQFVPVR